MNDQTTGDFDNVDVLFDGFDGIAWEVVCAGWMRTHRLTEKA